MLQRCQGLWHEVLVSSALYNETTRMMSGYHKYWPFIPRVRSILPGDTICIQHEGRAVEARYAVSSVA